MESTLMVLVTAASLIEQPKRWCQLGVRARLRTARA